MRHGSLDVTNTGVSIAGRLAWEGVVKEIAFYDSVHLCFLTVTAACLWSVSLVHNTLIGTCTVLQVLATTMQSR